jgi:NTE family protein
MTDLVKYRQAVEGIVDELRELFNANKFSDLIDDKGHQYVDLVMEGGGVLGIALVGYTYALERAGFRFRHIGGASAGAINAMLLAALQPDGESPVSDKGLSLLANQNLLEFVDGKFSAKQLLNTILHDKGRFRLFKLLLWGFPAFYDLRKYLGLNPGDTFLDWLSKALAESDITTLDQLQARLQERGAAIRLRPELQMAIDSDEYRKVKFGLITADITTQTKVEFPRMAPMYWQQAGEVNPACFVRASMSIPLFFRPYRVPGVSAISGVNERWHELTGYEGDIPKTAVFVDGGIMSNFPINLFHATDRVPLAPTFGARLNPKHRKCLEAGGLPSLLKGIFESSRHTLDYEFLMRHPDYRLLVAYIETRDFNWLDFSMSEERKIDLFNRGAEAALNFVRDFKWEEYKLLREQMQQPVTLSPPTSAA